jgi:cytochrome c biogenesis protein CcdA
MLEWANNILMSPTVEPVVLAAVFVLGLLGSVTSCCNLAVIGAISGYSTSQGGKMGRRDIAFVAGAFMLGTVLAMGVLGAVAGFVGQTIGAQLGVYWKIVAGLALVVLGLTSLKLVPFKLPAVPKLAMDSSGGRAKAILFGFAIGGGATACSACCNPVLPVVLGVSTLQGNVLWGIILLVTFAFAWSLPIAAGLFGLGLGINTLMSKLKTVETTVRTIGGVILIATGFFLIYSS